MKEEQKIYIRGSKDRPDDVRRVLEQNGGKVERISNFTYENCIYYINHDGIVDFTAEVSELCQMITEYYQEIKLPNLSEHWEKGDILVKDNDPNEFYVFDKFFKKGSIFIQLNVIKNPIEYKLSNVDSTYQFVYYTSCHKANDRELKTFYSILAEKNLNWDAYNRELVFGNNTYFYPKNGHYYFNRGIIRCKDRATGEWYDAVLYSDKNGIYARELNDFNTKFKKV